MATVEEIRNLQRIADGFGEDYSNDEILRLDLACFAGPVSAEQLAKEAEERLIELSEEEQA